MPENHTCSSPTVRFSDATVRKSNPLHVIDLPDDGQEIPVAIRHPDGGVVILSLRAHRGTLTAILPPGGVVRSVEDTDEVNVSWRVP